MKMVIGHDHSGKNLELKGSKVCMIPLSYIISDHGAKKKREKYKEISVKGAGSGGDGSETHTYIYVYIIYKCIYTHIIYKIYHI